MGKSQRAYNEFDHAGNRELAGLSEFMDIYGAKLLQQIAVTAIVALALFVGLIFFFG